MKISKKSAPLRSPSLCLRLSCLALAIAAWLGLSSPEQQKALLEESLFSKGWQPTDGISCPQLEAGKFYQLENELESRELFVSESGSLFISNLPNIEAPFNCHEIKTASHIKEI